MTRRILRSDYPWLVDRRRVTLMDAPPRDPNDDEEEDDDDKPDEEPAVIREPDEGYCPGWLNGSRET